MREAKRRQRSARRAAERTANKRSRRAQRTLAMLTTSALSLVPGLAQRAAAQTPDNSWSLEYGYSMYSEGSIPASKVSAGSPDRYDIDTHQFKLQAPLGSRFSLGFDVTYEKMTGASPWFIEPDLNGDPIVVMTGASIEDARTDVLGNVTYLGDRSTTTLSGGASLEDDYTSVNVGFARTKDYNQKNSALSWGLGFSTDTIDPTSTSFDPNPDKHSKKAGTFMLGFAQVLSRSSAIQSSLTYQYSDGYLSDPYKLVSAGGINRADRRPGTRTQLSWLTRYRQHFDKLHGSLHADYRFYWDTWAVLSHTIELGWYQNLFDIVTVAPRARYYSQGAADFYAPYFGAGLGAKEDASSDFRLSPYGAISYGVTAEVRLDQLVHSNWKLAVNWESYMSGGNYSLGKVRTENPALVDFNVLMVSLQAGF